MHESDAIKMRINGFRTTFRCRNMLTSRTYDVHLITKLYFYVSDFHFIDKVSNNGCHQEK